MRAISSRAQKTKLFAVAGIAGCGGDTVVKVQGTTTISKGQELTDLQRALLDGAIDQREYDELYRKIVKRPS